MPYLGHELYHDLKVTSPIKAQKLEDFIIDFLKNSADYDYYARVDEIIELNDFKGTRQQQIAKANEEIAANACFTVLSERENFESLVKHDRSLAQKVRDFFADFIEKIKDSLDYIFLNTAEYKTLRDDPYAPEKILSMFNDCLKESQKNNTTTSDSEIKLSQKVKEPLDEFTQRVLDMSDEEAKRLKAEDTYVSIMSNTPPVILDNIKDADDLEVLMRFDSYYLETRHSGALDGNYHNLGMTMAELPDYIGDPDAIVRNYNGRLNLITAIGENKNRLISVELNTVKDINSKYNKYNFVVSIFNSKNKYVENVIKKAVSLEYEKEDLAQVNHQLHTSLAIINTKSSTDNVPQSETSVNSNDMQDKAKYSLKEDSDKYKERQLSIIEQYNSAPDSYHTWIRNTDDIKTFDEALSDDEYADYNEFNPDYTREMAEEALESGYIRVYSSYPIEQGVFVTPSMMEAESYSGDGNIYSKDVDVNNVAWIDITQGQYAEIENEDIHYSLKEQPYSYEALTSKPDMKITEIDDSKKYMANSQTRKDIINQSIENAKKVGIVNENGNAVIYVDDIDKNIIVPKGAIKHSLDRRLNVNAHISLEIGKILKKSICINEMIPRTDNIEKSYVLIGIAKNKANEPYVVSFVVNKITNEVSAIDVLYAVNAKKEPTGSPLTRRLSPQVSTPATGSTISISDLLDYVNKYYPDLLPEDVLKHYGYKGRPEGVLGESALYSIKEKPIDYNAVIEENAELSEMNEDLKEMLRLTSAQNEKLKNEFKITDRHNISNNAVDKAAAALRKADLLRSIELLQSQTEQKITTNKNNLLQLTARVDELEKEWITVCDDTLTEDIHLQVKYFWINVQS